MEDTNIDNVMGMLEMKHNAKGEITGPRATLDNVDIILENDIRIAGKLGYDVVSERPTINDRVYWDNDMLATANEEIHPLLGKRRYLTDHDISEIQRFVQRDYGQKLPDIEQQILDTCKHHCFDPVKERLEYLGSQYDGGEYIRQLLPHFLGVNNDTLEDDTYQFEVMMLTMLAFIERQYNPGCKYDNILTITGDTGVGKTTFVQRLGFNDLSIYASVTDDVDSKDAKLIISTKRIIEFGEMISMIKSRQESLKDFFSQRQTSYRAPYARTYTDATRKCIFIATTNEIDFLTDITSSRRFLIVTASKDRVNDVTEILRPESQDLFDKAWGEAFYTWQGIRKLPDTTDNYLMDYANDLAPDAAKRAEQHYEYDPMQGMIMEYLDRKVANGGDTVCIKEILEFVDLGNGKRFERRDIANILDFKCPMWQRLDKVKRCGKYGPQRCWQYIGEMPAITTRESEPDPEPYETQEDLLALKSEADGFIS